MCFGETAHQGNQFPGIKLTESMVLNVDGISLFYTGLPGAVLGSCWIQVHRSPIAFSHLTTQECPSPCTGACHCQGFRWRLRMPPQCSCERTFMPMEILLRWMLQHIFAYPEQRPLLPAYVFLSICIAMLCETLFRDRHSVKHFTSANKMVPLINKIGN